MHDADLPPAAGKPGWFTRRRLLSVAGIGALGTVALGGTSANAEYDDREAARARNLAVFYDQSPATSMQVLWRSSTTQKVLALSFDDGPGPEFTPGLLDSLRTAGVRATFCVVGERAQAHADLLRRQHDEGHELVNHSWSHPDLSLLTRSEVATQLDRTNEVIERLTGRRPRFVRPPYGRLSGAVIEHVAESRQDLLMWHMRFAEEVFDSAGLTTNIVTHLVPGTIILGHDYGMARRRIGMAAVPGIVRGAIAKGYTFVTASQLLELDRAEH